MDFVASKDYKVNYIHKEGLFTYKQDFELPIISSGIMEVIEKKRWYIDPSSKKEIKLKNKDLIPFKNNLISYHSRKAVLFKKNYDLLPIYNESQFKPK